jgi:hypothetical protein
MTDAREAFASVKDRVLTPSMVKLNVFSTDKPRNMSASSGGTPATTSRSTWVPSRHCVDDDDFLCARDVGILMAELSLLELRRRLDSHCSTRPCAAAAPCLDVTYGSALIRNVPPGN